MSSSTGDRATEALRRLLKAVEADPSIQIEIEFDDRASATITVATTKLERGPGNPLKTKPAAETVVA